MIKGENYCIDSENVFGHEMIGLEVVVVKSSDKAREGAKGKVLDETQNIFRLLVKGKEVVVPKKECEFEFYLGKDEKGKEERVMIKGIDVLRKPENRLKEWKKE